MKQKQNTYSKFALFAMRLMEYDTFSSPKPLTLNLFKKEKLKKSLGKLKRHPRKKSTQKHITLVACYDPVTKKISISLRLKRSLILLVEIPRNEPSALGTQLDEMKKKMGTLFKEDFTTHLKAIDFAIMHWSFGLKFKITREQLNELIPLYTKVTSNPKNRKNFFLALDFFNKQAVPISFSLIFKLLNNPNMDNLLRIVHGDGFDSRDLDIDTLIKVCQYPEPIYFIKVVKELLGKINDIPKEQLDLLLKTPADELHNKAFAIAYAVPPLEKALALPPAYTQAPSIIVTHIKKEFTSKPRTFLFFTGTRDTKPKEEALVSERKLVSPGLRKAE